MDPYLKILIQRLQPGQLHHLDAQVVLQIIQLALLVLLLHAHRVQGALQEGHALLHERGFARCRIRGGTQLVHSAAQVVGLGLKAVALVLRRLEHVEQLALPVWVVLFILLFLWSVMSC